MREHCPRPSHSLSTRTLDEFLADQGVTGISDIDTRAVTRRIRTRGVMMGAIAVGGSAGDALERLHGLPRYDDTDFVSRVTTDSPYRPEFRLAPSQSNWPSPQTRLWARAPHLRHLRPDAVS